MKKRRKSKGWLQYEREVAEIPARIIRGEITEDDIDEEVFAAFERGIPTMSKTELRLVIPRMLTIHTLAANFLAAGGRPVPGNDPKKLN
jgi:hypothetical protein